MSFNEDASIDTSTASRGGGGGAIAIGGGAGGLIILVLALLFNGGKLPAGLQDQLTQGQDQGSVRSVEDLKAKCKTGADANRDSECRVLATENSLNHYWTNAAKEIGVKYQRPTNTVLFKGGTNTACGSATSAVGPFYCPADKKIYLDAGFFTELTTKFGANAGPLAEEYVVAHEFGHHMQNLAGVLQASQQDPKGAQSGAVRVELMADCFAGAWAKNASTVPQPGSNRPMLKPLTDKDIADALSAAAAVGDDRIQKKATGKVNPHTWTHGSAAQRQKWFSIGYQSGTPAQCNTLKAADLG